MKKQNILLFFSVILVVVFVFGIYNANAGGWEDLWKSLSAGKTITPGVQQSANAYNATATFTVRDGDGFANNFSNSDTIRAWVKGNGVDLKTPGYDTNSYITKSQLIEWAKSNKDNLLKAFFGASPEASFGGSTNAQRATQLMFTEISPSPEPAVSKQEKQTLPFYPITTKDIVASGSYDFMRVGDPKVSATGTSGVLSFESKFGETKNQSFGIAVPYRNLDIDDKLNSKAQFLTLMPYFKYKWYGEK